MKTKRIVVRPVVPWFNDALKKLKAKRRKLERKMLRSGFPDDKERFYNIRNKYSALLRETKIKYYSDLVDECAGNSKKLFRVIKSLSKQESPKNLPPYDDPFILANEFGSFFCRKIELINDEIDNMGITPVTIEYRSPEVLFRSFSPVTHDEIQLLSLRWLPFRYLNNNFTLCILHKDLFLKQSHRTTHNRIITQRLFWLFT